MENQTFKREYHQRSAEDWKDVYSKYLSSGLSLSKFCKEENIAPSSFSKWRDKFSGKTSAKTSKFKKLTPEASSSNFKKLELELPEGIKLTLSL